MSADWKGFECPSGTGAMTIRRSLVMYPLQADFRKISSCSYINRRGTEYVSRVGSFVVENSVKNVFR